MAVKTITIDLVAYDTLSRLKRPGQSFSDVIKERLSGGGTGRDLLEVVQRFALGEEALAKVEAQMKSRRRSRARAIRL
jgi:predicted CopG family antitoxin